MCPWTRPGASARTALRRVEAARRRPGAALGIFRSREHPDIGVREELHGGTILIISAGDKCAAKPGQVDGTARYRGAGTAYYDAGGTARGVKTR